MANESAFGLFGVTPESIRNKIGAVQAPDLAMGQLGPQGTLIANSSRAGRLFGRAVTGPSPEEEKARKLHLAASLTNTEADMSKDPEGYMKSAIKNLQQFGLTDEAFQVWKQLDERQRYNQEFKLKEDASKREDTQTRATIAQGALRTQKYAKAIDAQVRQADNQYNLALAKLKHTKNMDQETLNMQKNTLKLKRDVAEYDANLQYASEKEKRRHNQAMEALQTAQNDIELKNALKSGKITPGDYKVYLYDKTLKGEPFTEQDKKLENLVRNLDGKQLFMNNLWDQILQGMDNTGGDTGGATPDLNKKYGLE